MKNPPMAPWGPLEGEGSKAYLYFCNYRDLGADRSVRKTAEMFGMNPDNMRIYSKDFKWVERVKKWEAELDKRSRRSILNDVVAMRSRQIALGVGFQEVVGKELHALTDRVIEAEKAQKEKGAATRRSVLTPDQLVKLMEAGAKIERLNRGEPDSITQAFDEDLSSLSADELLLYHDLLKKIRG
ncbi:MAG: hypothetical protein JRD89_01530 [Deltaproteobacteria bacterium]|nr:hypothetical protein [Deltaproteobacteria bacterium]